MEPVTVAAVQAAPVFLDREATITKACDLIGSRREFDPVGHYARPDVFSLHVDTQPSGPSRADTTRQPRRTNSETDRRPCATRSPFRIS